MTDNEYLTLAEAALAAIERARGRPRMPTSNSSAAAMF